MKSFFLDVRGAFILRMSQIMNLTVFFFNFRYLVVLYYQSNKAFKKVDAEKKEAELLAMKAKYGLATPGRAEQEKSGSNIAGSAK